MKTATVLLRGLVTDRSDEGDLVPPWLNLKIMDVLTLDLEETQIEQLRDGSICIKTGAVSAGTHPTGYLSERVIPAWRVIEYETHEVSS